MKYKSAFESILQMRCPKCRQGKMFPAGTLYTTKFMNMHEHCSCCDQSFTPEPGYYFGAMFVSYAINAAFFAITWLVLYLSLETISVSTMIVALAIVVFGLLPVTF